MCILYVLYRTDPFSDGLLPIMSELHFLSGPQPDDLIEDHSRWDMYMLFNNHCVDQVLIIFSFIVSTELLPTPTLEMVQTQFYIPQEITESKQEDSRFVYCTVITKHSEAVCTCTYTANDQ